MQEINKPEMVDICSVRWGEAPAPLLPASLKNAWSSAVLPVWVCGETGLSPGSTISALDAQVWKTMDKMSARLRHFLLFLVRTRGRSVWAIKCIDRIWPVGLQSKDIAWSVRTRNCLEQNGLLQNERQLVNLTFGELSRIENMGVISVLDFVVTLEAVIDLYDEQTSNYAASHTGLDSTHSPLKILEDVLAKEWPAQISKQDPRFSQLLPLGSGTIHDRIEQLLIDPVGNISVTDVPQLTASINRIEQRIAEMRNDSLEYSLFDFLKLISRAKSERLNVLAARLGWNGNKPSTLEECGQQLGVTRERVRQIQNKALNGFPKHEIFMPRLDEALALLEEHTPLTLKQASKVMKNAGITDTLFHPKSLLEVAELLHKNTTLNICDTRSGKMLVSDSSTKWVQLVPLVARKLAGQSGVTSVFQVQDKLEVRGYVTEEDDLRRMLRANPRFEFLDDNWFWATDIKSKRNRLRNVAEKILSVVSPQSIQSIREGVRRAYRMRTLSGGERYSTLVVPPSEIMRIFFQRHRDFRVENEMIHSAAPLDYLQTLGETDRIMIEVLRSSPAGLLDRVSFAEACLARGMNENTFSMFATYSPLLEHLGIDIWKLRGVSVNPAEVEAVRIANHIKPKEKRVLDHGWTGDGKLRIAARIPRIGKNALVIGCPGTIQRYLVGQEFECRTKEANHVCGKIGINEQGSSYGYGTFIRRFGLDENDILVAEFDLSTNIVLLSMGNEEILDEAV